MTGTRTQAAISLALGAALATDHMPGFPDLPIAARAFGSGPSTLKETRHSLG